MSLFSISFQFLFKGVTGLDSVRQVSFIQKNADLIVTNKIVTIKYKFKSIDNSYIY